MNKKIYLYSLIIFILDFISKIIIVNFVKINDSIVIIKDFFYITYVQNTGGAWSIFNSHIIVLIIVSILIIGVIICYLFTHRINNKYHIIGYSLLLGGALGNLFDRIVYGYVIDFIDLYLLKYNYPVFNFADIAVVLGAIIIIFKNKNITVKKSKFN